MSSAQSASKLRRLRRILANPFQTPHPCDRCQSHNRNCTFIADFSIMSCELCTRQGKPCVTSSLERLDKVADDLAARIEADEKDASKMTDELLSLLEKIQRVKARISRNKAVQEQNNRRVEEQVRHLVENMPVEEENHSLSEAVSLGRGAEALGLEDPINWDFVPSWVDASGGAPEVSAGDPSSSRR